MWLVVMAASAAAEAPGELSGQIVDEDGLPLPGAAITLSGPVERQEQADVDGRYRFADLPPGLYRVSVVRNGFEPRAAAIWVEGGASASSTLSLARDASMEEEFYLDCEPLIDHQELSAGLTLREWYARDLPTGETFPRIDPMAPGVLGRAAPPDRLLWGQRQAHLLDGVAVTDLAAGAPAVSLNPEAIGRRDLLHTVVDPEGAQGLDGALKVYSHHVSNSAEAVLDVRGGPGGARGGASVSGPIVRDRAWLRADHSLARAEADAQTLSGKLVVQPASSHRVWVSAHTASPVPDEAEASAGDLGGGGAVVSGAWDWFLRPEVYVETHGSALWLDAERWRAGGGSTLHLLRLRVAGVHTLKAGGGYIGEGDEHGVSHHLSGFVQDVYQPTGAVTVAAGLRAEQSDYAAGLEPVRVLGPRLGVSWAPGGSRRTALKAAAWRTHSLMGMQLSPAQLQGLSETPAPRTDGVMVGAEQVLGPDVLAQVYSSWRRARGRYLIEDDVLTVQEWSEQRLDAQVVWETYSVAQVVGRYTRGAEDGAVVHDAMLGLVGTVWGAWSPRLGLLGALHAEEGAHSGAVNGRYWQRVPTRGGGLYALAQVDGIVATPGQARAAWGGLRYEW